MVFSAFPFTAVKALANSSLGETLQERAKQARVTAQRDAPRTQAARDKAKEERHVSFQTSVYMIALLASFFPYPFQH